MNAYESLRAPRVYAPVMALVIMITSQFVLEGCQAIEGIFKAGVWVGVLAILGIVALIGGGIALVRR